MCYFREKQVKNLTIGHSFPRFKPCLLTNLVKPRAVLQHHSDIIWPSAKPHLWHGFCFLIGESLSHFSFITFQFLFASFFQHFSILLVKTTSRKFHRHCAKNFAESAKDHCFFKVPQWQQKRVRECKPGKPVSYFSNNVAETYSYSRNIQCQKHLEIFSIYELNISRNIGIRKTWYQKRNQKV